MKTPRWFVTVMTYNPLINSRTYAKPFSSLIIREFLLNFEATRKHFWWFSALCFIQVSPELCFLAILLIFLTGMAGSAEDTGCSSGGSNRSYCSSVSNNNNNSREQCLVNSSSSSGGNSSNSSSHGSSTNSGREQVAGSSSIQIDDWRTPESH